MCPVEQLLKDDRWSAFELDHPTGPGLLRVRTPVPGPGIVTDHTRLLTVVWAYAEEGGGEMPDPEASAAMGRFENHLCAAVEADALAILMAVLTFDGARQWVFYTRDVSEFGRRLSVMPDDEGEPYPIELTTREDPTWSYLREEVLRGVPPDPS